MSLIIRCLMEILLMNKIKLAVLTPDYYPNAFAGIGVHVYSLIKNLSQMYDLDITVFVVRCESLIDKTPHIYENPNGVKVIEFTGVRDVTNDNLEYFTYKWTKNNILAIEYISTVIDDLQFDLIHCHDMFPIWVMDILRRKFKIPVVATIHARVAPENEIGDSLRSFLCKTADVCVAVSNSLAQLLIERYKIDNIKVIYNGISCRKTEELPQKENYITFCGRITKLKGVDILIRSFCQLIKNEEYKDLKLILIGEGRDKSIFEQLVKELKLQDQVVFKGKLENEVAREIISHSLLHIVPSLYEAFATVIEEAMMEKTCVIATRVGGAEEIIENGINGFLVEPNNVEELTEKMHFILKNPIIKESVVENAYKTVQHFQWSVISRQVYNTYLEILDKVKKDLV